MPRRKSVNIKKEATEESDSSELEYLVENILDKKEINGIDMYFLKWKGYSQ